MDLNLVVQAMLTGIVLYFVVFVVIVNHQRSRWRRNHRRGLCTSFYPTTLAIGLALQHLQAEAQPEVRHILEEKLADESEDDDQADSDDPQKLLQHQLKRIRNGERVDQLRLPLRATSR